MIAVDFAAKVGWVAMVLGLTMPIWHGFFMSGMRKHFRVVRAEALVLWGYLFAIAGLAYGVEALIERW